MERARALSPVSAKPSQPPFPRVAPPVVTALVDAMQATARLDEDGEAAEAG